MRIQAVAALALVATAAAFAGDAPRQFAEAEAAWNATKNDTRYQSYAAEFAQFNNHFHLDEKDGCYALGSEHVTLMLVIVHPANTEFSVVQRVLSDVDGAKAQCFRKSYEGISVKPPPFMPFILRMSMG